MDAFVEGRVRALECIAAEPTEDVGGVDQCFRCQERERAQGKHGLRSVDQRNRFLRFQRERLDLRPLQGLCTGDASAFVVEAFPFANESQREVRERSQITAGSDAALRRDEWSHTAIQHFAKGVDHDRAHAGMPFGERVGPQQHHGASFGDGEWFADAYCMRADKIDLKFADLVTGDADVAQVCLHPVVMAYASLLLATISSTTARAWLTSSRASGASSTARRSTATSRTASSVSSFPLMWSAFKISP